MKNTGHMRNEVKYTEQQVLDVFGEMHVPAGEGKDAAWNRLMEAIAEQPEKRKLLSGHSFVFALAASLALLMLGMATVYLLRAKTTIHAERGELVSYRLPDETEVTLNADSRVAYRKFGWKKNRRLTLEGEAFFQVSHGGDFRVETSEAEVLVVGTSFNVYSREGTFRVNCEKGVLLVSAWHFEMPDTLTGEQAIEINHYNDLYDIRRYETVNRPAASWITGEFSYEDAPLYEVFSEMERQFDAKIMLPDQIKNRRYTGHFRNNNLTEALNLVCIPMNVSFSVDKDKQVMVY